MPTELARGPWDPNALHGGPVAALVARAVEGHEPPMHVARLTVELLRPVPMAPLTVESRMTRPGRKVQLVEVVVRAADSGTEVTRAVGLRIRRREVPVPPGANPPPAAPPPGPETGTWDPDRESGVAFHNAGVEMSFVRGTFERLGPAAVWIRLAVPVVAGEEPTAVMRAAAGADFGNGVSTVVPWLDWLFINPDLTVHLDRPPRGEWVCLDASTRVQPTGVGLAESTLHDEHGPIGRAVQSLLVEPR